jgi:uncharacterized protein YbjT (DUF2867 family)
MSSTVSEPTVLVIGATGNHGRTGTAVVDQLIAHGRTVRVLTRTDDHRAAALRQRGASTVIGDLHDRKTLPAAVDGVAAVYFTYPVAAGVIPAAANLASVLVELGLRPHLVVMSMAPSSHNSPSVLGKAQALAEEILTWAGLNPTVLRVGALFHENVLILHGQSIREHGVITNCFGAARAPWIGGRDVAELAVRHLLLPAPPAAAVTYPPGAEVLSHAEIAQIISAETGQNIEYRPVSHQQWRAMIETQADSGARSPVNHAMAQHISIIGAGFASGNAPAVQPDADTLTVTLGHRPSTFAEFVREHRSEFVDLR